MIDAKRIVLGLDRFYSEDFQNTPSIKTSFSYAVRNSNPPRSSQDIKGLSGHGKAILQLYKVLTKLGILNGRFFKDRNIGKFACHEGKPSFVVDYLLIDYDI